MKARLVFADRDFDPKAPLPWNAAEMAADLELGTLLRSMAAGDQLIFAVARTALLTGPGNDVETIRFRQGVLGDCLANPSLVRQLFAIAAEAVNQEPDTGRSSLARSPDWVLRWAIRTIGRFLDTLERLRDLIAAPSRPFQSPGLKRLSSAFTENLDADYCVGVRDQLDGLRLRHGVLFGASLGRGNKGGDYVLLEPPDRRDEPWLARFPWLIRLIERISGLEYDPFSFTLSPLDSGNAQALDSIKNRGLAPVAAALGESAEHIRAFLGHLRTELAFYVGCINLHEQLSARGKPLCMPAPMEPGAHALSAKGLYDPALALTIGRGTVGNDLAADGRGLIFVTGANQGGKSTFLRSVGLAQLMMQCGIFAPASSFSSSLVGGLATHFRREEDATMESGKLDEELRRMSEIIDHVSPGMMILFNEPFAATSESEGSEIARQILTALLARNVRMISVTHLYELTRRLAETGDRDVMFLRAERRKSGERTFRIIEGEPLPSSFAMDLYGEVFGAGERE